MENKTTWKEWIVIGIIFGVMIFLAIGFIFLLESSWRQDDKNYNDLCPKNNLTIYKSSPDKPHIDGCYKLDGGIMKMYKLNYFQDKVYLVENNGL